MYKKRSKRYETWRIIFILVGMPLLAGVLLTLATLYMIDFRFNFKERTVVQGGLVQFDTQPHGAVVTLDGQPVTGGTPTRINTTAGSHTVTMTLPGYLPWQKTVTVDPGAVLWLNYAKFIPQQIMTSIAAQYSRLDQAIALPNSSDIYLLPDDSVPQLTQLQITNSGVKTNQFTIPAAQLTTTKGASTLSIAAIDSSGRYLLVEHHYGKSVEWIDVDSQHPDNSLNLSRLSTAALENLQFNASNSQLIDATVGGLLYQINITHPVSFATLKPLLTGVDSYNTMPDGTLLYVTRYDSGAAQREVGYLSPGANQPKIVRTFYGNPAQTISFIGGSYTGTDYFAVKYGTTLEIDSGALPNSDSTNAVSLASVATIALNDQSNAVSFSPTDRFVLVDAGDTYMTYDLELNKLSTAVERGDGTPSPLQWLDDTSLLSARGGTLQYYEFDGENSHPLLENAVANTAALTPNNQAIYTIARQASGGYTLTRISLVAKSS